MEYFLINITPYLTMFVISVWIYTYEFVYIKKNVFIESKIIRELGLQFDAIHLTPGYKQTYKKRGNSQCRFLLGYIPISIFTKIDRFKQSHRLISFFWFKNQENTSLIVNSLKDYFEKLNVFEVTWHKHNPNSFFLYKSGVPFLRITLHRVDEFKIKLICNLISPKTLVSTV